MLPLRGVIPAPRGADRVRAALEVVQAGGSAGSSARDHNQCRPQDCIPALPAPPLLPRLEASSTSGSTAPGIRQHRPHAPMPSQHTSSCSMSASRLASWASASAAWAQWARARAVGEGGHGRGRQPVSKANRWARRPATASMGPDRAREKGYEPPSCCRLPQQLPCLPYHTSNASVV